MLQFSIGKIPVEVRGSHVLFSFLLAFLFSQNNTLAISSAVVLASWVAIISLSVLVHELGHALASLSFGYQPSIVLVAMGGYTLTPTETPIPWLKNIALTLAGPLAGYALAAVAFFVAPLVPADSFPTLHYVCQSFFFANLVWSTFNLIPMGPLDGGRIAAVFFSHLSPKHGPLCAQLLGLLFGVPILLWALLSHNLFIAVFVGMFVVRSVFLVAELLGNNNPKNPEEASKAAIPTSTASLALQELAHIETLLEKGAYAEGLQKAENLLASALPPEVCARVHYLAGWLSIKSNQGRKALNHFSQTENLTVPPQAMAAALSLSGEDERALGFWETAALSSNSPLLLHEWAGTLLRLGKLEEAKTLPEVYLSKAYLCAESVFRLRREFRQAAQAAEASFLLEPQAEVAYEAACNYALAEEDNSALRMLVLAAQNGFREPQKALADTTLLRLHHHPEFQRWILSLRE